MGTYKAPALHTFDWQQPVIDQTHSSPPAASKGDRYIVADSAYGDWSGKEEQIATYNGASWDFTVPTEGMKVYISDEDTDYRYVTSWEVLPYLPQNQIHIPFTLANGSTIGIALTTDFKLPFWLSNGDSSPISLTT